MNELADRADRVGARGNGQVPAAAALAWRTLTRYTTSSGIMQVTPQHIVCRSINHAQRCDIAY